jgi:hypothetical protein
LKDAQRRVYLVAIRKRIAQKKLLKNGASLASEEAPVATENDSDDSENEAGEASEEKKVNVNLHLLCEVVSSFSS